MESSTDQCFGACKMAEKRCKTKQTGGRGQRNEAFMAQLLRASSRMGRPNESGEVAA